MQWKETQGELLILTLGIEVTKYFNRYTDWAYMFVMQIKSATEVYEHTFKSVVEATRQSQINCLNSYFANQQESPDAPGPDSYANQMGGSMDINRYLNELNRINQQAEEEKEGYIGALANYLVIDFSKLEITFDVNFGIPQKFDMMSFLSK